MLNRIISFIVILFPTISFAQTTVVHGKLLGADSKSMLKANVNYSTIFEKTTKHVISAEKDGSYSVTISSPGVTYLNFAGIHHKATQVPIVSKLYFYNFPIMLL